MPTVAEIEAVIHEFAPYELAEEWDNVGALVDCGKEVTSILTTLDITMDVVEEAQAQGCQLIVAHHPVIFHPLRRLHYKDVVFAMVQKRISAICAHTNLDAAAGGVNDILAAIFGIMEPQVFSKIGRIGRLRTPIGTRDLAEICHKKFGAHVRLVDSGKPIQVLAVMGGSGGGLVEEAVLAGADCVLTGEADHHDAIDAAQAGISLIVAGHFSTEFPVVPVLADRLSSRFPGVRMLVSRKSKDPFTYFG